MTYSAPVAAAVVRLVQASRTLEQAFLDRCGMAEDALSEPRFLLCLAQKAIDGIVLKADFNAIEQLGKAQAEIARIIKVIDSVLPKQARELHMEAATPTLLPLIENIPPLVDLVVSLDKSVSPTPFR